MWSLAKQRFRRGARRFTASLALLWLLIRNGSLSPGTVLLWDEPDANLNPSLTGVVAEALLHFQRVGIQSVVATHNYVLLRELDLRQTPDDELQYFSLGRDEASGDVVCHPADEMSLLEPNAIGEAHVDLLERGLRRTLEEVRTS